MPVTNRRVAEWSCARCGATAETFITEPVRADESKPPVPEGWLIVQWEARGHKTAKPYVTSDTHRMVGTELHWAWDGGGGASLDHFCPTCARDVLAAFRSEGAATALRRAPDFGAIIRERDRYRAVMDQLRDVLDAIRGRRPFNCGPAVPPRDPAGELERLAILLEALGIGA